MRCVHRTNIHLHERQTAALDEIARARGVSHAEVIRGIIDRALSGVVDSSVADHAAIDLSFGGASSMEVEARGPGARSEHLAAIWGQRS